MSRIGKMPVKIPSGVTVEINQNLVKVKGPKGELDMKVRPEIKVKSENDEIIAEVAIKTANTPAYWGLTRALIASMVKGVTEGYEKKLEIVGVGYRAAAAGSGVSLSLGFSHPIVFEAPEGIKFEVPDSQNITISGSDKQLVGQTAAKIRALRKPEPYKGKGIKYSDETIRRKAGKSGKV